MWIQIETGEIINMELLNNINPNHREGVATGYAAAILIVGESKALYKAIWPNGESAPHALNK